MWHQKCKGMFRLIIVVLLCMISSVYGKVAIQEVQVSAKHYQWDFDFILNSSTAYKAFQLSNPNRIVVDIQNAKLTTPIKYSDYVNTPVTNIRFAERKGFLRVVFDLNRDVKFKTSAVSDNLHHHVLVEFTANRMPVAGVFSPKIADAPKVAEAPKTKIAEPPKPIISSEGSTNSQRKIIVVIDPGHGGKDPGAIGRAGTQEKNVVLAISKELVRVINKQPGFTAKLTRTGDYYITLRQRLAIARSYHADLFVAIHADKWKNATANGASVFALSQRGATSEAARWLAARENESELMGGVDLSDKSRLLKSVLLDLSQTATIRASLSVGQQILGQLKPISALHVRHVEQAAFVVLKSPDIPSLLVETGFLSNPKEEWQLRNDRYRSLLARAIDQGITNYYYQFPPRGSMLAARSQQ